MSQTSKSLAPCGDYIISLHVSVNLQMDAQEFRAFISECLNQYNGSEYRAHAVLLMPQAEYDKELREKFEREQDEQNMLDIERDAE